jgi:endothelin-converting enzyme/putative endopeptidase
MFSSESSSIRHSLALAAALFYALIVPAPGAMGQDSSDHASGPKNPSELRVFDPSLIDKSIDPCGNFYLYSCNGWFKRNPLPPDQAVYGRFTELCELNRLHLKQSLDPAAEGHPEYRTANESKIGDDYASCLDTATIDSYLKP